MAWVLACDGAPPTTPSYEASLAVLEFEVGADEAMGPDHVFGSVSSVVLDADGRLYVADHTTAAVRIFGPGGTLLRTLGRQGQGPGEFDVVLDLTMAPDGALWIRDLSRVQRFQPRSGSEIPDSVSRIHTLTGYSSADPVRGAAGDSTYFNPSSFAPMAGGIRYFFEVFSADGTVDTLDLPALPRLDRVRGSTYRGGRLTTEERRLVASLARAPFEPVPQWAVSPDGTIFTATGDASSFDQVDLVSGLVRRTFRIPAHRRAIPQTERNDSLEALRSRIAALPVALDEVTNVSPAVEALSLPDSVPGVLDLQLGADGSVWAEVWAVEPGTTRYARFDTMGRFRGFLDVPARLTKVPPYFSANRVSGVVVDPETEVEHVAVFRFPAGID